MKRRDFIGKAIATTVIPTLLNGFSLKGFAADSWLHRVLASAPPMNDHVLVMVRLTGGNDGLNTVIPIDVYANYYNARTNIAIPENRILPLTGINTLGLHPSMTGMQTMYNEEKLCVVQSAGYPNSSFSHFRATDIWMSASDSNEVLVSGWAGRYLDYEYEGFPNGYPNSTMTDPLAIQIGSVTSLALQGANVNMGMSISDPTNFYNFLNGVEDPLPGNNAGKELSYIRSVVKQTQQYSAVIKNAALNVTQQATYPDSSLAAQLKIVARLVKGGLKTRVYMVEHKGFDTHSLQTDAADTTIGDHANLLTGLSEAIKAFQDDLSFLQIEDRIVGMTFSEFGRRIKSNSSGGTDHGAAAPMFIFGKNAKASVLGTTPDLPVTATVNDNIAMQHDFRSVYASLLEQWLCVRSYDLHDVMLRNFQSLPLIDPLSSCNTTTYVFNGNGSWTDPANWAGNVIPPANLSGNAEIVIEPQAGGKCILNISVTQRVFQGARIIVKAQKDFVIEGNLINTP